MRYAMQTVATANARMGRMLRVDDLSQVVKRLTTGSPTTHDQMPARHLSRAGHCEGCAEGWIRCATSAAGHVPLRGLRLRPPRQSNPH
eukprot:8872395-Pyramimonas_sp.AAC.1